MSLDMSPEQKAIGRSNFHRAVGKLADPAGQGPTRREFMRNLIAAGAVAPVAAAAYFGYSNSSFNTRPVKAALIGAGDEGGVLVGEHNPAYLQFSAFSDIRPSNVFRIFENEKVGWPEAPGRAKKEPNPNSPRLGFKHHYGNTARQNIRHYADYKELLRNPEIEMVVIAVPLHLHAQVAIDCLAAGKHVLCEKLMAWNIRDCKRMIKAARDADKLLAVGHQRHYSMLYAHAVEVLNSGVLGDIRHIRALWHRNNAMPYEPASTEQIGGRAIPRYRDSWRPAISQEDQRALTDVSKLRAYGYKSLNELVRWRLFKRTGGGLMAELGSHQLDACSIFLGKRRDVDVFPIAVTATGGKHFYEDDREVEDHVYCTYEFPGKNYDRNKPARNAQGHCEHNDIVSVTYSSISTNSFEPYGECVMGSRGTLVLENEQSAMLWGGLRSTAVTVATTAGRPALSSADSPGGNAALERSAADTGQNALGQGPPSRGYREEMEHFAYCIRMRHEGMSRDRDDLKPRCDGKAAMGDAIIALSANEAMRSQQRVVFDRKWFDPAVDDVPPWDPVAETI